MRKVGYYSLRQERSEFSFIRPLGKSGDPRFHLYIKTTKDPKDLTFNLHLDQKRPVYKGAPAHAGEREGKVVETEAERR